jgi:uncharacterized lipoprotein YddW (UPF0748 family)
MLVMNAANPSSKVEASSDVRAVWISYIDFEEAGLKDINEASFRSKVSTIYDEAVKRNINTVYVHARVFNDAIYPSPNFPWSEYITSNKNGPGYDPLKIMVELAHQKRLKIEAWMNPYRISTSSARTSYVKSTSSSDQIARMIEYKSSSDQSCLVWNPADAQVRSMIANEAGYIVQNYAVDGIHFDDYFYDAAYYGNTTADQRRSYVNDLVKGVYSKVKSIKSGVRFGISPIGNVYDCLEDGADVRTWLSNPGYIDYLVPQIYWSDSYGLTGATHLFTDRLNEFLSINKNNTDIYVGLALYKVASKPSPSTDPGWSNSSDNLAEQVRIADSKGVKGFSLFSSAYLNYASTQTELNNLINLVRSQVALNGISPGNLTTTVGKQETITVNASGGSELLYQYHIYNYQTGKWTVATDYKSDPSLNWTFLDPGRYQIMCFVKDKTSLNSYDKVAYCETTVNPVAVTLNGINPGNLTTTVGKQETITVDASADFATELLYQYHVYNYQTGTWTMATDYTTNPSLSRTFLDPGRYQIMCFVKDKTSKKQYDKVAYCETTVNPAVVTLKGITPGQLTTTIGKQETISVDASADFGTGLIYQFYLYNYQTKIWTVATDYTSNPALNWTFWNPGRYQVMCFVKDKTSKKQYDKVAYCETTVNPAVVTVNSITPGQLTTTAGKQEAITVSASETGGAGLIYQYHIYNYQTKVWTGATSYGTNPTLNWTFSSAGRYQVMCFIKDKNSANSYDKAAYCEVTVK